MNSRSTTTDSAIHKIEKLQAYIRKQERTVLINLSDKMFINKILYKKKIKLRIYFLLILASITQFVKRWSVSATSKTEKQGTETTKL